jgi:uncharacterized protein YqgC (DUF456 family)
VVDTTTALLLLAALLCALGIVGTVLPALPGAPLLFAGLLLAAWAEDFAHVGRTGIAAIGVLALLSYGVDLAASAFGARRFGASRRAVIGAGIGAFAGLFFGIPGILIGPFAGAVIGELSVRRSLGQAGRAGLGAAFGLALGAAAKLALSLSMVGVYLVLRFT